MVDRQANEYWDLGRQFERDRISAIIKCNIKYMEGNPEGYTPSEIAIQKRLLETINNLTPEYKRIFANTKTQENIDR